MFAKQCPTTAQTQFGNEIVQSGLMCQPLNTKHGFRVVAKRVL